MEQSVYIEERIEEILPRLVKEKKIRKVLVVCDAPCKELVVAKQVAELAVEQIWFSDFTPNPNYESVVEGVKKYKENDCDAVLAIGGGSSMDVAKCIKLYATMNPDENYLRQTPKENAIPLMAIPTTAGTGSEATRFAVIYYDGEKQSIVHDSIIPKYVFLNSQVLVGLPDYQKKATAMDAMCHAIESFWSVNSNEESKKYSVEAIVLIRENLFNYLKGDNDAAQKMFRAANLAGKAINITQTTAGHAMCYKITSLFGLSHGHAAAVCVEKLWPYMIKHVEDCLDARGVDYLNGVFVDLADAFGCKDPMAATEHFSEIVGRLEISAPKLEKEEQFELLVKSVNLARLKNNPVKLSDETLRGLYQDILKG